MTLAQSVKTLRAVIGVWFVAGLVGRGIVLARARREKSLQTMATLLELSGRFEKLMVVPGSIAVLVAGLLTMWAQHRSLFQPHAWWLGVSLLVFLSTIPLVPLIFIPRGKRFGAAYQQAEQEGAVTNDLWAAYADPWVAFARTYEVLAVACVLVLMVSKPF